MALSLRRGTSLAALLVILVIALVAGIAVGTVPLAPLTVLGALAHPHGTSEADIIVWALRLPRVLIAALVGGTLAVVGAMLQGMLRNPLGDPGLTGGSAGAAFAIAVAIVLGVPAPLFAAIAFCAALASTMVVAVLARSGSGLSTGKLILAGIAIGSLFGAGTTLIIMRTPNPNTALAVLSWLGGSLVGHGWSDLGWAALYSLLGAIVAAAAIPGLNALRLGEQRARSVGVDIARTRWIVLIASALLTAAAVSVSGVIGFIGLIVPHAVRALCGSDVRWSIPACLPAGATIVIVADIIARINGELPIGVLVAFIGVPTFLFIAFRQKALA